MRRPVQILEHQHDDGCGCGHDHEYHHDGDECGCGHGHEHHHDGDECGCGHDHGHEHHHGGDECGCGHDHEHHHDSTGASAAGAVRAVYLLENLGCAHCAAKMEEKIQKLPGVKEAVIVYTSKQLRLTAEDPDGLLPQIEKICTTIEPDVKVVKQEKRAGRDHGHEHHHDGDECGCGHDHEHDHHHDGDECGCGHDHDHHHDGDECGCGHDHEHDHHHDGDECGCGHDHGHDVPMRETASEKKPKEKKPRGRISRELLTILLGAVLFVTGEVLEHLGIDELYILLPIYIAAYVILGIRIVWTAIRNIAKGQVFDENFLMSVATIGAFAIQEYPEAVGVMLFYRIGEFFEEKAVERSRSQIMDAVDMRPEVVNLVTPGGIRVIPAEEAGLDDIVLVRPGDRVPLDGVIVEGESRLDTSAITGEPVPVHVQAGDQITSGCVNTSGQLKLRVEKVLEESMVTRILDSVENAAASKPKIDRFITKFAKIYTPVVVALALGTAIVPSLVTGDWDYWVYTALSFLVMSCPCALVLSIPLSFFSGIGAGSRKGILFKGGLSIEALSNVKAVVMDKTGTITKGNFVVQEIVPADGANGLKAGKKPTADESRAVAAGADTGRTKETLLALCAGCEVNSTHPIAASIVEAAKQKKLELVVPEELEEIAGHGIRAVAEGREILCGNKKLLERYGAAVREGQHSDQSGSVVYIAVDGAYAGYILVADTIKKDAKPAMGRLKRLNVATAMLTGDRQESAEAVAREVGIDEVRAKLLPEDKLSALQGLREKHGSVMFVGDGINDAPVLAGADVGAAMGSGADAAIEAADVVYMTSDMEAIPESISIARQTKRISWQNVIFALAVKIAVMILGLCGFASMWAAVFADTGVAMICVLNSIRILYRK